MDYRELLKKYMTHVRSNEGTDFTRWLEEDEYPKFSNEEIAELQQLSQESKNV